jgi:hypothetical protein
MGRAVKHPDTAAFGHRAWSARAGALTQIRREVRRWLAPLEVMPDAEADLVLAVNEAAANAIDHAYRTGDDKCSSRSGHRRTSPSPRRSPSPGDRPYICGPPGRCWPATHA